MQLEMDFDVCESRHGGNAQSEAAFVRATESGSRSRDYWSAMAAIDAAGVRGLTGKEFAAMVGKGFNAVSGRFAELKRDGLIRETGERREGCAVCVATGNRRQ